MELDSTLRSRVGLVFRIELNPVPTPAIEIIQRIFLLSTSGVDFGDDPFLFFMGSLARVLNTRCGILTSQDGGAVSADRRGKFFLVSSWEFIQTLINLRNYVPQSVFRFGRVFLLLREWLL